MSHTVRAKFRCNSVVDFGPTTAKAVNFTAVMDNDTPENERYAKYTPSGQLNIHVDNPAVVFEPGKAYYLDFTPAD